MENKLQQAAFTSSPKDHPAISLPPHALQALELLEQAGYEAWVVGGFVRDSLLGRATGDVDMASNALWQEMEAVFSEAGFKTIRTGVQFGTLTVVIDEQPVEITTFRHDSGYADRRHPSHTSFVASIEQDLARRDFTVNALAFHPKRGLLDPFGGVEDAAAGVIRAVGNPKERFREDALRILRACRFVSVLGFAIEAETYQALYAGKRGVLAISPQRAVRELDGLLLGEYAGKAIMETVDVLSVLLPELAAMKGFAQNTPYHIYDVLEHTARVIEGVPPKTIDRWAALFHDMGKPACYFTDETGRGHFAGHGSVSLLLARSIMGRLLFPKELQKRILLLIRYHDVAIEKSPKEVKRYLRLFHGDMALFTALCDLKRADALAKAPDCFKRAQAAEQLKVFLQEVLINEEAFLVKDLAIDGRDIIALGVEAGLRVGELLDALLDGVIEGRWKNTEEELLFQARLMVESGK